MTAIQWTQQTWNPIVGCSVVSPGCTNCYAMRMAWRMANNPKTPQYHGLTRKVNGQPVWTGKVRMVEHKLTEPLKRRTPTTYFVNSMGDLFHEDVPDDWIDRVFAVMALASQHRFQVLTKRGQRMRAYFDARRDGDPWAEAADEIGGLLGLAEHTVVLEPSDIPLPNVHLGVSAEDQRRADERIPDLRFTPAAVRFVSYEPALGPIDFTRINNVDTVATDVLRGVRVDPQTMLHVPGDKPLAPLDWVIVGGESGPGARLCHVDWIRSTVAQCQAAGVPVFVKQFGSCFVDEVNGTAGTALKTDPDVVIARRLTDRKGGTMSEWPADLKVREMPE
jgi:protein gp37